MFNLPPPQTEEIFLWEQKEFEILSKKLQEFDQEIDIKQLRLISMQPTTWSDGSLGCPMPGEVYTKALVPGFLILVEYENTVVEIHTSKSLSIVAIPGIGFI